MTTEERVMSLFERSNPVPDTRNITPPMPANHYLETLEGKSNTMSLTATESTTGNDPRRNRPWLMLAAAACVAVIFVGIAVLNRSDGAPPTVAQPNPTTPAEQVDRDAQAMPGQEDRAPDSVTESEDDPIEAEPEAGSTVEVEATSLAVANQFVEALEARDKEAVLDLVAARPLNIDILSAHDRTAFGQLFGWFDAVNWQFEPVGCEFSEPDQVQCSILHRNDWFAAGDIAPVNGTLFLKVENGQITALRYGFDTRANSVPYQLFRDYVRSNHPDDVPNLWAPDTGDYSVGPILTEDAFNLFEQYTDEYLASLAEQ